MRNTRRILALLTVLVLALMLFACGGGKGDGGKTPCDVCLDTDGDKKCDVCGKDMPADEKEDVLLFDGEDPTFQIVIAKDIASTMRQIVNTNVKIMLQREYGVTVDVIVEGSANDEEIETEVLIGTVKSRGDKYALDGHDYGKAGYAIDIVGSKIVIVGGCEESLITAVREFADEILDVGDIADLTLAADDVIINKIDDYSVTALKIGGKDIKGKTIAADLTRDFYEETAYALREELYERVGYWFEIVDIENASDSAIVIKHNSSLPNNESYRAGVVGDQFVIECSFDNMLDRVTPEFAALNIYSYEGDLELSEVTYKRDISTVTYEYFGARGDGRTDDFKAIYDAHVFANISGQKVLGNPDATYYIHNTRLQLDPSSSVETVVSAPIGTDTDWRGAKFIIDDSDVSTMAGGLNKDMSSVHIFTVIPDPEHKKEIVTDEAFLEMISAIEIKPGTTKIDLGLGTEAMIVPNCSTHKVFRRRGYGGFAGEAQHEIIVIDAEGNVSEETPIMFHYTDVTSVDIYRFDSTKPLVVKNGEFTTWDTKINHLVNGEWKGTYIYRGINVARSYTTVQNVNHKVEKGFTLMDRVNGYEGNITSGFYGAIGANHVTFKDCLFPARMSYTGSSTYNVNAREVNKFVLDGCVQTNFWVTVDPVTLEIKPATVYDRSAVGYARRGSADAITSINTYFLDGNPQNSDASNKYNLYYGVCGTNYCKNIEYLNTTLARLDAHAGLYNGKVINTNIADLELTGTGYFEFRDSDFHHSYIVGSPSPFLYMRSDYGYTWDGLIEIKNVKAYIIDEQESIELVRSSYTNWYYGYTCAFPSLIIDNLDFYNVSSGDKRSNFTALLSGFSGDMKHLLESNTGVWLGVVDENKDGFIDEPLYDRNRDNIVDERDLIDLDGNGVMGETSFKYEEHLLNGDGTRNDKGVYVDVRINVNVTKPPEYIKIVNLDEGYKIKIRDTAGKGISDGAWYDDVETFGGFFGDTKFYYGTGENDYFVGTRPTGETGAFVFD